MNYKRWFVLLFILPLLYIASCTTTNKNPNKIVVAIPTDIESLDPMYSFSINEANINELLFLSLIKHNWNNKIGNIDSEPMLAKSWKWSKDSLSLTLNLRNDVKWSDDKKVTAEDVVFSFDLFSDPSVQSYMYGSFGNFYTDKNDHILLNKTFKILSPYQLIIKFKPGTNPTLFDIDFPIIPKHIFEKLKRSTIANSEINLNPVTDGPFKLKKWVKNQYIILEKNNNSFLVSNKTINELIFKVVPDYNSRISQLKNGEIDLMEYIKTDDVDDLKKLKDINISQVKGREYDYIGWSNIDNTVYTKTKKIKPNFLFGSSSVRKALTYAINRREILKTYLKNFGSICVGPVSPIFKNAFDSSLTPYNYNPQLAKQILQEDGWTDSNHDGILDKAGKKFEFTLTIPSGNPRRTYAATIVKQDLSAIGISVNIETLELSTFINELGARKFNAWMAGWIIPLPTNLKISWYSDLNTTPFNFEGYRNKKVDQMLDELEISRSEEQKNLLLKEIQKMIHQDEPATFLYWVDNIIAYNNKIKGMNINPLGVVHHCWNWSKD